MHKGKLIPYGISNFQNVRLQNYIYVDKTKYIELLENYGEKYIFFLRPRRFGKSLFISLLSSYYDVNTRDEFTQLFDGLYIGANPTPLANSYYVLRFNFSGINTSGREMMLQSFNRVVLNGLSDFIKRYDLDIQFPYDDQPADVFNFFLTEVSHQIPGKIYVLIDEYDHFANELLSFQVELFEETISKTGWVRKWYEVLKIGTEKGIIDRLFGTGVSPVTLDGLTSGFNIASNLTRDVNLNEMLGFTENEVVDLFKEVLPDQVVVGDLLPELKQYYNGYLFSEKTSTRVFNSDMILYYLNSYQKSSEPPIDLIDTNISSDYTKMQKLFTLGNRERNYQILESILHDEPQTATITREYSLAKEFTSGDFLSLLFYLGFLTIEKPVLNRVQLKVPNYVIKEIYFDFFAQVVRERMGQGLDITELEDSIERIALDGSIDEFVEVVEKTLANLSNRDYLNFDEKYVKLLLVSYLMLSKLYYVKSEYEVKDGYIDIAFFKRSGFEDIYEGLIELKYIKKADYEKKGDTLVRDKLEQGKNQLAQYGEVLELQAKRKLLRWVLVFAGDKCMAKVQV